MHIKRKMYSILKTSLLTVIKKKTYLIYWIFNTLICFEAKQKQKQNLILNTDFLQIILNSY